MNEENKSLTWFRLDQRTDSEQLHNFLITYLPFKEVINLYRLLEKDLYKKEEFDLYGKTAFCSKES